MKEHPATYSASVLDVMVEECLKLWDLSLGPLNEVDEHGRQASARTKRILDTFAGIGKIHLLRGWVPVFTWGLELEPEWAVESPWTEVAECLAAMGMMIARGQTWSAIFTSPCYGNRMADHHDAQERCRPCKATGFVGGTTCVKCHGKGIREHRRITYRHKLGRALGSLNTGRLQWGRKYRDFHTEYVRRAYQVVEDDGYFVLNISNHIRGKKEALVSEWWVETMETAGFERLRTHEVETPRMGFGQNYEARTACEFVHVFAKRPRKVSP